MWGEIIEPISNKSAYKITHLKIRKFQSEKYVTATPISCVNPVEEIDVSVKGISLTNEFIVHVKEIGQVGDIHGYGYCPTCNKKIVLAKLTNKFYMQPFQPCNFSKLQKSSVLLLICIYLITKEELTLTATTEYILGDIMSLSSDFDIIDKLLEL